MPAFAYEYALARADGVRFEWLAQPVRILADGDGGSARGVEFVRTELEDPSSRHGPVRPIPGACFRLEADLVVKALGQEPLLDLCAALPELRVDRGRIVVDRATGATSVPRLFAGGDCLRGGGEVVDAVQDGKVAAQGIHVMLVSPEV
jgi:glutamate synthase (NADPH/NADH) small chain